MMRLPPSLLALAGALALAAWQPAAAQEQQTPRNPLWAAQVDKGSNLYSVTPTFYRSARLQRPDIVRLQALGVKTVVSLRALHSDTEMLANSGIKTVRIPIYTWNIKDKQMVQALRAIRVAERDGPVLLHCQHGADRTGLVTAMYRVLYQQRSKEQALEELKHGGYGYHTVWKNIESYLRKVNVESIRSRVDQP